MSRSRFRILSLGKSLAAAALAVTLWPVVSWAVLVSPHAVFMDHRTRTGEVILFNSSTQPEEVSVDLTFGYPDADSAGAVFVRLIDTPDATAPSAASWIRAFPRRLTLQPHERQVVRLLATPPAGLQDGEYWSRIIITSQGARVPVTSPDSVVRAGVSLVLRTVTSLTYRKGAVRTGVVLRDVQAEATGDSIVAWTDLERDGNAAYLGTVRFALRDSTNRVVRSWDTPVAVYYRLRRRYAFPTDSVAPGRYALDFDVSTAREDVASSHVLPAAPIHRSLGVVIGH